MFARSCGGLHTHTHTHTERVVSASGQSVLRRDSDRSRTHARARNLRVPTVSRTLVRLEISVSAEKL